MSENRVWIPNFIRKVFDFKSNKKISAKELNAILNLLVTQGDYNSEWLEYLHKHGIPDAIAGISQGTLTEVLTEAVRQEIEYLTASVSNKASRKLDNPLFTFVDLSMQVSSVNTFIPLLESQDVVGCVTAYPELVGNSTAYPTEHQLLGLKAAGHHVICGTSSNILYPSSATNTARNARDWLVNNELSVENNVFVYPASTNPSLAVRTEVDKFFSGALNTHNVQSDVDSDTVDYANIPVVQITTTNNLDNQEVQAAIENTVLKNNWCVFVVDSSSDAFDSDKLVQLVAYVKTLTGSKIVTADTAVEAVKNTINRRLSNLAELIENTEKLLNLEVSALRAEISVQTQLIQQYANMFEYDEHTGTLNITLNGGG